MVGLARHLVSSLIMLLAIAGSVRAAGPPKAPAIDVTDEYFGEIIHDPYRWMEDESVQFADWLRGQGDYTRGVLDRIPGRDRMLKRLHERPMTKYKAFGGA